MTEIPEHLLKRSRDRKAAGGDAPSTEVSPGAAVPATTGATTPTARVLVDAEAQKPAKKPDPAYITAAKTRGRIPSWAMATLAFQVVFEWTVGHLPLLNQGGAMPLPRVSLLGYEVGFRNHYHFWYYVSFAVLVLLALFFRNLLRTKYGRALVAVRDNDRAADAMGMDPGRTKLFAFALGAFYAGVAGALYAYLSRAVVIEDYTFSVSIKLLAMAIVGGLGTLVGSFLGPAFLELLDVNMEALSNLIKALGFSVAGVDVASALRPLAFGLVIVLFLVFEPRGLYNWWRVMRSYFRTWPFRY